MHGKHMGKTGIFVANQLPLSAYGLFYDLFNLLLIRNLLLRGLQTFDCAACLHSYFIGHGRV